MTTTTAKNCIGYEMHCGCDACELRERAWVLMGRRPMVYSAETWRGEVVARLMDDGATEVEARAAVAAVENNGR